MPHHQINNDEIKVVPLHHVCMRAIFIDIMRRDAVANQSYFGNVCNKSLSSVDRCGSDICYSQQPILFVVIIIQRAIAPCCVKCPHGGAYTPPLLRAPVSTTILIINYVGRVLIITVYSQSLNTEAIISRSSSFQ